MRCFSLRTALIVASLAMLQAPSVAEEPPKSDPAKLPKPAAARADEPLAASSLNADRTHYITNAGTAYAVMALKACEVKDK
jgi:hypothetical protein